MVVTCTNCKAKFKIADEKVAAAGPAGVKVRCSKCKTVFAVSRPADAPELVQEAPPPEPTLRPDTDSAPTRAVPVPDELRYEGSAPPSSPHAGDIDLDAPSAPPPPPPRPAPKAAPARAGSVDDDPFANIDIDVPEPTKPKIPAGMKLGSKPAPAPPKTQPDAMAAPRTAAAAPPPPPPAAKPKPLAARDEFGNIELGGEESGLDVAPPAPRAAAASMLDDTPPGLMNEDGSQTPAYAQQAVQDDLNLDALGPPPQADDPPPMTDDLSPPPATDGGDPFGAATGQGDDGFGAPPGEGFGAGALMTDLDPNAGAAPEAERPAVAPSSVMLGRVKKEEDDANAALLPPPPPLPIYRRVLAHLVNLVALVAIFAVGAVAYASYKSGGRLEGLSPDAVARGLRGEATPSLSVSETHSGVYDTAAGPLLYVMGTVDNGTPSAAARVKVTAVIVERSGRTVKWEEGFAGAVPTPEELTALKGPEDLARLKLSLESRATSLPPGGHERFFIPFDNHPAELHEMSVQFATEAQAAVAPPQPPPVPAPAPEATDAATGGAPGAPSAGP